jgi:hypothetical protein
MTTPRDSNIKVDDNKNNQEDDMRELIATQNQLNQETAQFIANTSGEDPTLQKFLETQAQILHKVTNQMLNWKATFPKELMTTKMTKMLFLKEPKLAIFVETRITLPRSMKINAPTVKRNIQLTNAPQPKLLVTYVKEIIMSLSNAPSIP